MERGEAGQKGPFDEILKMDEFHAQVKEVEKGIAELHKVTETIEKTHREALTQSNVQASAGTTTKVLIPM